ncbi:hypothetical protein L1887_15791 [Cichorium endivia]|nr:hypothetical protein L1887_15791 [Cichorium endivia]
MNCLFLNLMYEAFELIAIWGEKMVESSMEMAELEIKDVFSIIQYVINDILNQRDKIFVLDKKSTGGGASGG